MKARPRFCKRLLPLLLAALLLAACTSVSRQQRINEAEDLRNLGEAYMIEGKHTMALKELLRAEKLYADDPFLQNDLGLAYMDKERLDLAVDHLRKAIKLKPDWPDARNNLATAYLRQEKWDQAIAYLNELSENLLYTTPHYAYLNLGWAYFNKGDFAMATRYYRKTLSHYEDGFRKDGTYLKALVGLGRTLMRTGQTREAVSVLEKAAEFGPNVAAVYLNLGKAYAQAGNRAKARKALARVMQMEPGTRLAEEARIAAERLK